MGLILTESDWCDALFCQWISGILLVAAVAEIKGATLVQLVRDVVVLFIVHAVQNLFDLDQMVAVFVQRLRAILDRRLDLDFDDVTKLLLVDRRFTAIT